MKTTSPDRTTRKGGLSRRNFLVTSGTAAAAAVPGAARSLPQVDAPSDKRDVVLHDTPHIRTYYKLARD